MVALDAYETTVVLDIAVVRRFIQIFGIEEIDVHMFEADNMVECKA